MKLSKNLAQKSNIFNFLFFLFPISYIVGNLGINLVVFLIILATLIIYNKEIFKFSNKNTVFLLLFFFSLVIVSTFFYRFKNLNDDTLLKSFLYLRYFFLFVAVSHIIKKNDINFKYFFLSCLICSTFLSVDVIYQSIFNKDIFGITSPRTHNAGFFGHNLIAGGYIQRFLLLGVFFIPLITKNFKKFNFLFLSTLVLGFFGILLSGNRMPTVLFVLFVILAFFLIKKFRFEFLLTFLILPFVYFLIFNSNENFKESHKSFWNNVIYVLEGVPNELKKKYPELKSKVGTNFHHELRKKREQGNLDNEKKYEITSFGSGHTAVFVTAIETWLDSPIIGFGIRSFRKTCQTKLHLPNRVCENHPHNYYLDILNSVGVIGFLILLFIIYSVLKRNIKLKSVIDKNRNYLITYPILICLILEFFPLRSSGSFFGTANASYIFLLLGIVINLTQAKKYLIFKKKKFYL
jgi:O-antigen ligase